MVAKKVIPPFQPSAEDTWQLVVEFTLVVDLDSDRLIANRVAAALEPLDWSNADVQRRTQALIDATRNVIERSYLPGSTVLVTIRVLTRAAREKTRKNKRPGRGSEQQQPLKLSPFRGQGFFLVHKQVQSLQAHTGDAHFVIELFVY